MVGDSVTAGYTDNPTWSVPFTFGFRGPLYEQLKAAGKNFQFVGGRHAPLQDEGFGSPSVVTGTNLANLGQDNHEGQGGAHMNGIAGNVGSWVTTYQPDIVMLMAGINDIPEGASGTPTTLMGDLDAAIAAIQVADADVPILLAKITPYYLSTPELVTYNNYIATLASAHIIVVDQYSNFITGGGAIDTSLFANGINHPNQAGYAKMATTWANAILPLL